MEVHENTGQELNYFAKKRFLIIGAAGAVGKACSLWLLNKGAKVAMASRKMKNIQSIGAQFPNQAVCIKCDLVSDEEQFDMVNGVLEAFGGLDALINCAGVIFENDLESTFPQDHDYLIDINLRSFFHISQLCSIALYKCKGCIVNLTNSRPPQQGMISYCMSKAGLDMLTKCLAMELAPVRVNAVAPGFLADGFLKASKLSDENVDRAKARLRGKNPLKRLGRVDEIVKAIIFLCSPKARTLTGQIIQVDGGAHCTNSSFIHWNPSTKMNSKFVPSDLKIVNKFANWYNKKVSPIVPDGEKPKNWIDLTIRHSNWFTSLADAHIKIYENYEKLDSQEDYLGIFENMKCKEEDLNLSYNPIPGRLSVNPEGLTERYGRATPSLSPDESPSKSLK